MLAAFVAGAAQAHAERRFCGVQESQRSCVGSHKLGTYLGCSLLLLLLLHVRAMRNEAPVLRPD